MNAEETQTPETTTETTPSVRAWIEEESGLRRTVKVEAPAEHVNKALEDEYRKIQRKVTIKGFRKGRAPLIRIKSMFGAEAREEALNKLFNTSYPAAIRQLELQVAAAPTVTEANLNENEPFTFTAEVEVFPKIEKVDLEGLVYSEMDTTVTDKDVDEVIESLRRDKAPTETVSGVAEENDVITADLLKTEDKDNVIDGNEFPDSVVDLSHPNTVKEFKSALVGVKSGDVKDVTVSYPKDHPDAPFAGKTISYKVTVKKVERRFLPELNDSFANTAANIPTLLELRQKVRESIKTERDRGNERQRNNQLISQVVAKNPVEAPDSLVSRYVDDVIADFRKNYPGQAEQEEEVRNRYRLIGANQLRWKLLSDKICEQEKIEVSVEDTDKWIADFAARNNIDPAQARNSLAGSGRIRELIDSIREEKILDFLRSKATKKAEE